ncbi:hypothetical protein OEA41_002220 [Lepraria neglecta]|uniref:Uncharacterized protein n=1 Tax=Lepraria neglecta TaxID=209136 RepID=A0AAE0DM30_9LECA|nr:hypothetical protein OEA41_002220 [Lepraria neglecta]
MPKAPAFFYYSDNTTIITPIIINIKAEPKMCQTLTVLRRSRGCGHDETHHIPCKEAKRQRPCLCPVEYFQHFPAQKCRNCVEQTSRQQEETQRQRFDQERAAAGLAQAARAAEALNRRLYGDFNTFRPHGEPGQGAAALGRDIVNDDEQQDLQRANAGLAQAARAAEALRRRMREEYNMDGLYEELNRGATPVSANNGQDDDGGTSLSGSETQLSNPYATPPMTLQPSTSGHDSSHEIYSGHDPDSDDVSGSTHFYDDSSEASSSQEPGSSDEGYSDDTYTISGDDSSDDDIPTLPPGVDFMTRVGGVRLEAEYIYNGSPPSSVGELRASSPDLDNQGEQDEEKEERKD